jgi:hypothetical protein
MFVTLIHVTELPVGDILIFPSDTEMGFYFD